PWLGYNLDAPDFSRGSSHPKWRRFGQDFIRIGSRHFCGCLSLYEIKLGISIDSTKASHPRSHDAHSGIRISIDSPGSNADIYGLDEMATFHPGHNNESTSWIYFLVILDISKAFFGLSPADNLPDTRHISGHLSHGETSHIAFVISALCLFDFLLAFLKNRHLSRNRSTDPGCKKVLHFG
ncbi:MAG TPA: hypothetical protein PLI05_11845, partial [Methanotrichaceae archaeon]|nr:hypothetical protein [Methanotrichaceae archaeon]HQF17742.1 hypothetical protein [Methanotrichaceae archaeon]HQI92359.1 hypothetical protein [Methanotrichaceae archaeon]